MDFIVKVWSRGASAVPGFRNHVVYFHFVVGPDQDIGKVSIKCGESVAMGNDHAVSIPAFLAGKNHGSGSGTSYIASIGYGDVHTFVKLDLVRFSGRVIDFFHYHFL